MSQGKVFPWLAREDYHKVTIHVKRNLQLPWLQLVSGASFKL